MYRLESDLVQEFENNLVHSCNPFDVSGFASEFYYISGRVDIVGSTINGDLVAFEAKLHRWRVALNQAYRNSSFAHYSYVVLPYNVARIALQSQYEFIRRGIGLCSIGASGIRVEIPASSKTPLQPWLTHSALDYIARGYDG